MPGGRASTSFELDMADLRPVFRRLGFDHEGVAALVGWVKSIEVEDGKSVELPVTFKGRATKLFIGCFIDDILAPGIEFRGGRRMIEYIEKNVREVLEHLHGQKQKRTPKLKQSKKGTGRPQQRSS